MPRKVKVAVVGSGLAGLTAAYLLTKPTDEESDVEFDLHLFEKVRHGLPCAKPVADMYLRNRRLC